MSARRGQVGKSGTLRVCADLIVALGLLIAVGAYLSIDQAYSGFSLVLATSLAGLGYLIGCGAAFLIWMTRFRWARTGVSAIKAGAFAALFLPCLRAGDYVHLALYYPTYRQQIEVQGAGSTTPIRFF